MQGQAGSVITDRIRAPLSVAPMLDWTDNACRHFHRLVAPGAVLYTEMVHANAILHGPRERLLAKDATQHPVALQLGGSDPATLAAAARIGAESGFDEINLNCGCPSDRVQSGQFGACLMLEPQRVADCVAAMREAVDVPVTIKCRLGVDTQDEYEVFAKFIDTVAAAGCDHFVVHARNAWLQGLSPKENREVPPLRYDWAYRLKQERPELFISLNGGIREAADIAAHLEHVDAVMLGRLAYHEPYALHQIDAGLFGRAVRSRHELLAAYRPYVGAQVEQGVRLNTLIKPILGLFAARRGGRAFRQILSENAHRPGAGLDVLDAAAAVTDATD